MESKKRSKSRIPIQTNIQEFNKNVKINKDTILLLVLYLGICHQKSLIMANSFGLHEPVISKTSKLHESILKIRYLMED